MSGRLPIEAGYCNEGVDVAEVLEERALQVGEPRARIAFERASEIVEVASGARSRERL